MPNIELTPEVLKERVTTGGSAAVIELINEPDNQEDTRSSRLNRSTEILKMLSDQQDLLHETAKRQAIEACRLVLQEEIEAVSIKIQESRSGTNATEELKRLRANKEEVIKARDAAVRMEMELASLAEKVGIEHREINSTIGQAIAERDWKTLGKYAAVALASGLGLKWLWDKTLGRFINPKDEQGRRKPGVLSKLMALPGIVFGAAFLARLERDELETPKALSEKAHQILPEALHPVSDATIGAGSAIMEKAENAGEVATEAGKTALAFLEAVQQGGDKEALSEFFEQGWVFVKTGTGFIVSNQKEMFTVPAQFGKELYEYYQGNSSVADVMLVYGAAGFSYVLGKAQLKLILNGTLEYPNIGITARKMAFWPIESTLDVLKTLGLGPTELTKITAVVLKRYTWYLKLLERRVRLGLSAGDQAGLEKAMRNMDKLLDAKRVMVSNKDVFNAKALEKMDQRLQRSISRFTVLAKKKPTGLKPWAQSLLAGMQGSHFEKNYEKVSESMHHLDDAESATDAKNTAKAADASEGTNRVASTVDDITPSSATRATEVAAEVADTRVTPAAAATIETVDDALGDLPKTVAASAMVTPSATPPATADTRPATEAAETVAEADIDTTTVSEAARPASVADDVAETVDPNPFEPATSTVETKTTGRMRKLMQNKRFEKLIGRAGLNAAEVEKILASQPGLEAKALYQIEHSPSLQKVLIGALQADEASRADELTRFVASANKVSKVRVGFNLAGGVADLAGALFCAMDYLEYEDKIATTNNPALRSVYQTARPVILADGVISLGGVVYGTAAAISAWSATGSIAAALGASVGWVMLPIGLAALGARHLQKNLEESVEYHTASEQELMQMPPGALLDGVQQTASGSKLNIGQMIASWGAGDTFENANMGARAQRYQAYFARAALITMPQVNVLHLLLREGYEDFATWTPQQQQRQTEILTKDWRRKFVNQCMYYIEDKTGGNFDTVSPDDLYRAEQFALNRYQEYWGNWDLIGKPAQADNAWHAAELESNQQLDSTKQQNLAALAEMGEDLDTFEQNGMVPLLLLLRHDTADFERKILAAGYYFDSSAALVRGYALHQVRGVIDRVLDVCRKQKRSLTEQDIAVMTNNIKSLYGRSIDGLYDEAKKSEYADFFEGIGADPSLLTTGSIAEYLQTYPTNPPALAGVQSNPVSMQTLRFYQNHFAKHPLLMDEQGAFFADTQGYWFKKANTRWIANRNPITTMGDRIQAEGKWQFWKRDSKPRVGEAPDFEIDLQYQ